MNLISKKLLNIDSQDQALIEARKLWRSLGVGYSVNVSDIPVPVRPESLLVSTSWLFAYDFYFESLVAAWVKHRCMVLDYDYLLSELESAAQLQSRNLLLSVLFLHRLSRKMIWHARGIRYRMAWLKISRVARSIIQRDFKDVNNLITKERLAAVERFSIQFKFWLWFWL